MRPERLYLLDILEAADAIVEHLGDRGEDAFARDRTVRAAVLHELTVIGEAAGRLSEDLRGRYPDVPWPDIVAFRNFVVHEYFGLSWPIVWNTATSDVPSLRRTIKEILASEFPEDEE
jgi:uncharacterized protein with HEPN domain